MSYLALVPAFIPKNEKEAVEMAQKLSFAAELQIDLVDGRFAPNTSWPIAPEGDPLAVKSYLDKYTLEIDLMVEQPIEKAKEWEQAGADMLVFHVETITLESLVDYTECSQASIGVSAHGDTSLEKLESYIQEVDYVQLMGIREIGFQGQVFDETVLDKIKYLRQKYPNLSIGVDGSVNPDTVVKIKEAGADRFVCGSAIVRQSNPEQAYNNLLSLIK